MPPACLASLRSCAPADLSPRRQAVYDYYQHLVDDQLKFHVGRLRRQRQMRPRRLKESDYGANIRSEIADEISDCRQRLFLGLATAVERLRKMSTLPSDIEKYIMQEIGSQARDHHREDCFDIIPPASTNSTRPKDLKYQPLKRQPNTTELEDGVEVSILERRSANSPHMPSAQQAQDDDIRGLPPVSDLKDELARNFEERAILDRLEQGEPRRKIAVDLDVTEHRVRLTIELFKQRTPGQ